MAAQAQQDLQAVADPQYAEVSERTITYDVGTAGEVSGDLEEFREIVKATLTDVRGWTRAGVTFEEVEDGGMMHVRLTAPEFVGSLDGCSDDLSCMVYPYVYLNETRWMNGSESYAAYGIDLKHYRQMLTNHEVGHFLGHWHVGGCETATGQAPVMIPNVSVLGSCVPTTWPLPSELWTNLSLWGL